MEPLPETVEVVDEHGPFSDADVLGDLSVAADRVCCIVPDCVGLSLVIYQHGVTLTMVATRDEIAALDAVQYLSDGPCLQAVRAEEPVGFDHHDLLDEVGWGDFALATAAQGIASTLTLPLFTGGRVTGSINMYAASPGAFASHHDELAAVFGAWAPGAVTDADLDFDTRTEAREAPQQMRDELQVLRAAGLLAGVLELTIAEAQVRISDSALRSGISRTMLAEFLITTLGEPRGG